MIVSYNGTALADSQVEWTESTSYERDERMNRRAMTRTVTLKGFVKGDSQTELKSKINAIWSTFSTDGGDLILYHNDGTTQSSHTLPSSSSLTGVMIDSGPSFDNGSGPEYATERTYTVVLSAKYPLINPDNYVAYTETLRIVGTGGPRRVGVELLTGLPQIQIVNQRTLMYATQAGSAVGYAGIPAYPGPIPVLAPYELLDKRSETMQSPQWMGNAFRNYGVSWSYEYLATNIPAALPNYA